jgi:hypothetical protein
MNIEDMLTELGHKLGVGWDWRRLFRGFNSLPNPVDIVVRATSANFVSAAGREPFGSTIIIESFL